MGAAGGTTYSLVIPISLRFQAFDAFPANEDLCACGWYFFGVCGVKTLARKVWLTYI